MFYTVAIVAGHDMGGYCQRHRLPMAVDIRAPWNLQCCANLVSRVRTLLVVADRCVSFLLSAVDCRYASRAV